MADLATQFRASKNNSDEENDILNNYYSVFDKLVNLHKGIIALDPDAELPEPLMPKQYTEFWLKKDSSN